MHPNTSHNFNQIDNMASLRRLFASVAVILAASAIAPVMNSQELPAIPKLPLDTAVRYGVLPNGLTYYIRHNERPKGQADFYIAQKVGSILEEENQRGLAHFLEHMCFNGTENFPGNSLIDYLESVGVKFGANLNAYTSIDETVYNITNVPTDRKGVQDSVLLILHDWADGLLLDPEEIDKERGVIHEEWRRSMVGQMRILEKLLPEMYPGSRYGHRLPIGTIDVIDNFKPQEIREYYETWYRPDQQGIIVVGDIDVDYIEGKIKELFSPIQMPENPKERVYLPVEDTPGTIFAIGTDPEQGSAIVELMFKQDALPREFKGTQMEIVQDYLEGLIVSMLNERLNDISNNPDSPFAAASAGMGDYVVSKTKNAFEINGLPKDGDVKPVLSAIYREALRASKGGFTQGEYDRAKAKYMANLENQYNNRNNVESGTYVRQYIRNFIDGDAATDIETKWNMMQQIAPMIPLQLINQGASQLVTPDNRVVLVLLPEADGFPVPTPEELQAVMNAVDAEEIEAYVDEMRTDPFIPELPSPGTITSETTLEQWDAKELTLSNGVKVIVKPTKFKDDEILIQAQALGGIELLNPADSSSIVFMPYALQNLGYGSYTDSDVSKYLAGKKVMLSQSFQFYQRSLEVNTTPKDLQTAFEVIYNYFTAANLDENEFNSMVSTISSVLANQEAQPQYQFSKTLTNTLFKDSRQHMLTTEAVQKADREKIVEMIRQLTSNAADYTFVIVGNVNIETLKPLLEQYVATLPSDPANITALQMNAAYEIGLGNDVTTAQVPMQTEQTYVGIFVPAQMEYTAKDRALASIASQILSKRLIETVREEIGATYSISALGRMERPAINNVIFQTAFPMKPEMKEEVLTFIQGQFNDMTGNVNDEEFNKVIEYMVKTAIENKEKNTAWSNGISGWLINSVDTFNGDSELYKSLTTDDVKDFMKRLMEQNNYRVVVVEAKPVE